MPTGTPKLLLTPEERAEMKRYFLAARQWDKHRRDLLRDWIDSFPRKLTTTTELEATQPLK